MARRLIVEGRYIFVLLKEAVDQIGESDAHAGLGPGAPPDGADPRRCVPVVQCDGRVPTELGASTSTALP